MPRLQLINGIETFDISYSTQGKPLLEVTVDCDSDRAYFGMAVTPQDLEALRAFCEEALAKFDDCPYERTPEEEELLNFTPLSDEELATIQSLMPNVYPYTEYKEFVGLDAILVKNPE